MLNFLTRIHWQASPVGLPRHRLFGPVVGMDDERGDNEEVENACFGVSGLVVCFPLTVSVELSEFEVELPA